MQRKEPPTTTVCLIYSSINYFFLNNCQVPFQLMLNIRVPKSVSEEVPALRSRVLHLTNAVD